jgi:carbon monoxide dehydrogenase subunit G
MADFLIQQTFKASPDTVWSYLGDFGGIGNWMPGIEKSEVAGDGIGATRKLYFNPTTFVVEALKARDETGRSLSYSIEEGPMPIENYLATISVVEDGDETRVDWSATFDAPEGVDPEAIKPALSGAYAGALTALKKIVDAS